MKNTLTDLNNILFEQLERINDEDLTDEQLDKEVKRASEMSKLATQIIQAGNLQFKAMQHMDEFGYGLEGVHRRAPQMLEYRKDGT